MANSSSDVFSCRICLEEGQRADFIAPCLCSGTSKWVHRSCLDRWRSIREDKAFSSCTECLAPYKLVCTAPEEYIKCSRRIRFICYVCRDFFVVLLIAAVVVGSVASLTFLIDVSSGRILITVFKMGGYPFLFYFLAGFILCLAFIGMYFSCIPRSNPEHTGDILSCSGCDGMYFYPYPYAVTSTSDSAACCCCPGECAGCHASNIACCECGECASAGAVGEEAFVCLIGVMIVFAVVGVFYCLGMGAYYLQYVTQRHIHVLGKLNLTSEYVVEDLAEDALPGSSSGWGKTSLIHEDGDVENCQLRTRGGGGEGEDEGGVELSGRSGWLSSGVSGYARVDGDDNVAGLSDHLLTVSSSSIIQPAASAPPMESSEHPSLSRRHRDELNRLGLL
jgi:hypothetical protein